MGRTNQPPPDGLGTPRSPGRIRLRPTNPGDREALVAIRSTPEVRARWRGDDLLAEYLFADRGHHRLTIDPAADNEAAIACYANVGFRPVGVLRRYERQADGTWADGLLMELLDTDPRRRPEADGRPVWSDPS